jgi:hypothetical protein
MIRVNKPVRHHSGATNARTVAKAAHGAPCYCCDRPAKDGPWACIAQPMDYLDSPRGEWRSVSLCPECKARFDMALARGFRR